MRPLLGALLAACAAAQLSSTASITATISTGATPSFTPTRAATVVSMGELLTTPSLTLRRTGTVEPQGRAYFSFTHPAAGPQSFTVFLSVLGSASTLSGGLNTAGLVGGISFASRYTLAGTPVASRTLLANDPTVGMAGGQTWFVEVRSTSASALTYNLTVQTVAAPSAAPSPGFMATITPDARLDVPPPVSVPQLPLNSYVYYSFSVPTTSSGFRVELQPTAATDADLYLSRTAPVGATFTSELQSEAASGALDAVTITPTDAQWVPSGGPYYIMVKAFTQCAFTLRVVLLGPTPSPIAVFPTAPPAPGQIPPIGASQPLQAAVRPDVGNGRACYRFRSSPSSGEFSVVVRQVDNLPINVSVFWAWPPSDRTQMVRAVPSPLPLPSPVPGFAPSVTARVFRTTAGWLGYAGEYFVCAEAGAGATGPATFRLTVTDLDPSTASPSPRALTVLPLPLDTPVTGASLEWGAYRFYTFEAPVAGPVSFRLIPTRQAIGTTGGTIQDFEDAPPADLSDWWVTRRAATISDGRLTLTNGRGQRGFAWLSERRAVWPSFAITFDFAVLGAGGVDNGDGMCFAIHNDRRGNTAEGGVGDSLGVGTGGLVDGPGRIERSIAVCVDTSSGTAGGLPFPNTAATKYSTYLLVDGNMTGSCARTLGLTSGCAFPLPDLSLGSNAYTLSMRVTRNGGTASSDAAVHWSITDSYTGVAVGAWQRLVRNYTQLLNLGASSSTAFVGFTAATSTNFYSVHSVRSFFWGWRDTLLTGTAGGNSDLYVSSTPPTSPDSFSMADTQSTGPGVDAVRVETTDTYYRGAGGRYWAAVYCAGPSGCTFTLEATVGVYATMTPTPALGIPSASPSALPSLRPEQRLLPVNISLPRTVRLPAYRASYFAFTRQPGYFGPITFYADTLPPTGPRVTPDPVWAGLVVSPDIALSLARPSCPSNIFGGAVVAACSLSRDVLPRSADQDWITLEPSHPSYPTVAGAILYVEVRNRAPVDMGAAGNLTVLVRVGHDAGPAGAAPADATTPIIIAVVVAGVVIAAVVMGGLVAMKRIKRRGGGGLVTVMTTAQPTVEVDAVGGKTGGSSGQPWFPPGAGPTNPLNSAPSALAAGSSGISGRQLPTHNPAYHASGGSSSSGSGGMMPPPPPPVSGSRAAFSPQGSVGY